VRTGARECRVMVAYAPNVDGPLDVVWEMEGLGQRLESDWFRHSAVIRRRPDGRLVTPPPTSSGVGRGFDELPARVALDASEVGLELDSNE